MAKIIRTLVFSPDTNSFKSVISIFCCIVSVGNISLHFQTFIWCHNNNLSLNISKTKVVDFRKGTSEHPPHQHRWDSSSGAGQQHQVPRHKHHWGPHLDYSHTVSNEEGPPASLLPQATEEIRSELKNPQTVLRLHCGEHPDWLHHRLVRDLHRSQPESPAENSSDGPAHRRRWASFPQDIYTQRCVRNARKIIRDSCHTSHELFSLLPSGRRYRSIRTQTSRTSTFEIKNLNMQKTRHVN